MRKRTDWKFVKPWNNCRMSAPTSRSLKSSTISSLDQFFWCAEPPWLSRRCRREEDSPEDASVASRFLFALSFGGIALWLSISSTWTKNKTTGTSRGEMEIHCALSRGPDRIVVPKFAHVCLLITWSCTIIINCAFIFLTASESLPVDSLKPGLGWMAA